MVTKKGDSEARQALVDAGSCIFDFSLPDSINLLVVQILRLDFILDPTMFHFISVSKNAATDLSSFVCFAHCRGSGSETGVQVPFYWDIPLGGYLNFRLYIAAHDY